VFFVLGSLFMLGGMVLGLRFLYFWLDNQGAGNVQSLILASILLIFGFQTFSLGLLADLLAANRKLAEEALYRLRRQDSAGASATTLAELPELRTRETPARQAVDRAGGGS